jgi:hypothetical protein
MADDQAHRSHGRTLSRSRIAALQAAMSIDRIFTFRILLRDVDLTGLRGRNREPLPTTTPALPKQANTFPIWNVSNEITSQHKRSPRPQVTILATKRNDSISRMVMTHQHHKMR